MRFTVAGTAGGGSLIPPGSDPPAPTGFATGAVQWDETFTYADTATIGTPWTAPGIPGQAAMGVASGAMQRTVGSGWSSAVTEKTDFTRGVDVAFEIAAVPDSTNQVLLEYLAGTTSTAGYIVNIGMSTGNTRFRLQRWTNNSVSATHVDVTDAVLAAGDAIGMRVTSTGVELWRRLAGGPWTQVGSTAADTTISAGTIAVETNAGATRIDRITVRATT